MSKKTDKALLKIATDLAEGQRKLAADTQAGFAALNSRIRRLEAQVATQTELPFYRKPPGDELRTRANYLIRRMARRRGMTNSEAYHLVYDIFTDIVGFDPLEEASKMSPPTSGIDVIHARGHLGDLVNLVQQVSRN